MTISDNDRRELLRIARITLKEYLVNGRTPPGAPHRQSLLTPAAAFVTVRVGGALRGCIGHVEAELPLYKAVVDLTVSAATRDPRFPPLRREDLAEVRLSISVLSPLVRVTDVTKIEVGTHGLVVAQDGLRGLLLPQVAVENGWDRQTFLTETCHKAGLAADAWEHPATTIDCFTAEVFGEP